MTGKRRARRGYNVNIPDRWLTDPAVRGLSSCEFTMHVLGMALGSQQESDGFIPRDALWMLVTRDCGADETVAGLVARGVWREVKEGWQIANWSETQSTRAEREHQRNRSRANVQAWRDRQRESDVGQEGNRPVSDYEPLSKHTSPDQISTDQTSNEDVFFLELEPAEQEPEPVTDERIEQVRETW